VITAVDSLAWPDIDPSEHPFDPAPATDGERHVGGLGYAHAPSAAREIEIRG
jgi:hypothetical protein